VTGRLYVRITGGHGMGGVALNATTEILRIANTKVNEKETYIG